MYRLFLESEPRVYESLGRCSHSPVCEIVQPCSTQCLVREMCNDKNFVQNKHVANLQHTISLHRLVHFYDTHRFSILEQIFLSFYTTLNFFSVTIRLTDVQRSQVVADAIILGLMCQLLGLRETGRLADRPRSGRPRLTSLHQDRAIRLAHLRYRHLTTTEIALNTVSTHNPSGTFALSSLNYHRNCPQYRKHS